MRPLSPNSESIGRLFLQQGHNAKQATVAINSLCTGQPHYGVEDVRNFQRTDILLLSQQISHLESQWHGIANATGGVDDQIKALKNDLCQALTQKISNLQRQNSSLTITDASRDRQIQDLQRQLQALHPQNPRLFPHLQHPQLARQPNQRTPLAMTIRRCTPHRRVDSALGLFHPAFVLLRAWRTKEVNPATLDLKGM